MKVTYEIKEIDKATAMKMVQAYHYSNTLPRINKHYVGFFLEGALVGVVTLGYGTRPKHTIQRLFPSLKTMDYYEIGRMCMTEDMPRCSESQMLSQLIRWIRQKLLDLIKQCIEKHSDPGNLVLDGFAGAGTTALATRETGRHFLAWEIDDGYYNIASARLAQVPSDEEVA